MRPRDRRRPADRRRGSPSDFTLLHRTTPLGHLRVLAGLVRERGADEITLDEIDRTVGDLDTLLGKLLADARPQFSALSRTRLAANAVTARALAQAGAPAKRLVPWDDDDDFDADPTLVARALGNLLENAQEHGGGMIAVRVTVDTGHVRFAVDDDGPGFVDDDLERAFDPFVRGRSSSNRGGTTLGLGLSVVRRRPAALESACRHTGRWRCVDATHWSTTSPMASPRSRRSPVRGCSAWRDSEDGVDVDVVVDGMPWYVEGGSVRCALARAMTPIWWRRGHLPPRAAGGPRGLSTGQSWPGRRPPVTWAYGRAQRRCRRHDAALRGGVALASAAGRWRRAQPRRRIDRGRQRAALP